jgi:hypothetical protein
MMPAMLCRRSSPSIAIEDEILFPHAPSVIGLRFVEAVPGERADRLQHGSGAGDGARRRCRPSRPRPERLPPVRREGRGQREGR